MDVYYAIYKAVMFILLIGTSESLREVKVVIPRAVRSGHSVTLVCDYKLDDSPLYSVKWYRQDDEFYRYVPKEEPPTRVFEVPGIHVDVSVSGSREVTLLKVSRAISGVYRCEVSADAPLFHTVIESATMTVVELPEGMPTVVIHRLRYAQGGPLIADCNAPPSYPAANLTWFVNDQKVPGLTATNITPAENGLESASSRLELSGVGSTTPGPVKLRCLATLFKLYKVSSADVEVRPDSPPAPASVLDNSMSDSAQTMSDKKYSLSCYLINSIIILSINYLLPSLR